MLWPTVRDQVKYWLFLVQEILIEAFVLRKFRVATDIAALNLADYVKWKHEFTLLYPERLNLTWLPRALARPDSTRLQCPNKWIHFIYERVVHVLYTNRILDNGQVSLLHNTRPFLWLTLSGSEWQPTKKNGISTGSPAEILYRMLRANFVTFYDSRKIVTFLM